MEALKGSGLIEETDGVFIARTDAFATAAQHLREPPDEFPGETPERTIELRKFFKHGRLTRLPASHSKRMMVLDYISGKFEPGDYYTEAEVNSTLQQIDQDYVTLRRLLIDEGFLERDPNRYWRAGGSFLVD